MERRQEIDLRQKASSIQDLIYLMRFTPSGSTVAERFLSKLSKGLLDIEHWDQETPEHQTEKWITKKNNYRIGAAFYMDEKVQKLMIDFNQELGVLLPMFFHEATHAIDESYVSSFKRNQLLWESFRTIGLHVVSKVSKEKNIPRELVSENHCDPEDLIQLRECQEAALSFDQRRLFKTEKRAYHAQALFTEELSQVFPAFKQYVAENFDRRSIFRRIPTDEEIIKAYELNPAYFLTN